MRGSIPSIFAAAPPPPNLSSSGLVHKAPSRKQPPGAFDPLFSQLTSQPRTKKLWEVGKIQVMEEMKAQPFLDAMEALRQGGGEGKTFGGHETCPHLPPPNTVPLPGGACGWTCRCPQTSAERACCVWLHFWNTLTSVLSFPVTTPLAVVLPTT